MDGNTGAGNISSLTKVGTGSLRLTQNNPYTGSTSIVGGAIVLATSEGGGPPVWFVVVTSAALAVIMPALFYPFTKTIWVAAEIWMNRFDSGR